MATWTRNGKVLLNSGRREHKGVPRPKLTPEARMRGGELRAEKRQRKVARGKPSYQPGHHPT